MNFNYGDKVYSEEFGEGIVIYFSGLDYFPTPFIHVKYKSGDNCQYTATGQLLRNGYDKDITLCKMPKSIHTGVLTKIYTTKIIKVGNIFCKLSFDSFVELGSNITVCGYTTGTTMLGIDKLTVN